MRRKILPMVFSLCGGILLAYYSEISIFYLCISCIGIFLAVRKRGMIYLAVLLCFAAGFFRMDAAKNKQSAYADKDGQAAAVEGIVKSVQIRDYYVALNVKCSGEHVLVRLSKSDDPYDLVGREIDAVGKITFPNGVRNPGDFDYSRYLRAKNTYVICRVSQYKFSAGEVKRPVLHFLSVKKGRFFENAKKYIGPDNFGLLAGLMFGEKSYMDEETYERFQTNGIAHILAVSGLHMGLLYGFVQKLFKGRRSILISIVTVCILFCYAALSDFSVSVLRAFFMSCFSMLSYHLRRRYDIVCAASAVVIGMLLVCPYLIFDSGMQLSFTAAYSMGVILPFFQLKVLELSDKKKKLWIYKLGNFLSPMLAVQLGMTPLCCYHFLNFSPLSFFINPVAIFLASLLLPVSLIAFVFPSGNALFAGICGVANFLCTALNTLSASADKIWGGISVCAPPLGLLICYYGCLFFFFSELRFYLHRRGKRRSIALLSAGLVLSCSIVPYLAGITALFPWKYNEYPLVFLDVGQGDCAHIRSSSGNILIDGGGKYGSNIGEGTLKPYLLKNGVSEIDLAFVTHLDMDHSKGIKELSEQMNIKTIAFPVSCKGEDLSGFITDEIIFLSAGDEVSAGDVSFRVISPFSGEDCSDKNESSLVLKMQTEDFDVLFTADIDSDRERMLLDEDISADLIKIAHHGSAYSSSRSFILKSAPSAAVISVGKNNNYNHPSPRVLEVLQSSGIIIFRTDESGALCVKGAKDGSLDMENGSGKEHWHINLKQQNTLSRPSARPWPQGSLRT